MTTHNTRDLIGRQLNWAVRAALYPGCSDEYVESRDNYSTCWNKAGPIIERERMLIKNAGRVWVSYDYGQGCFSYGPDPLVAAMRCYVASKLGDTVELPEGL